MKKIRVLVIPVLILAMLVATLGCSDEKTTPPPQATPTPAAGPVKIGVLTSLTGVSAWMAQASQDTIDLVTWYIQQKGGILGGRPVQFIMEDNESTVEGAVKGAEKLILQDGVVAITGGGATGAEHPPAAQTAERYNVLYSSFFGDSDILKNTKSAVTSYLIYDTQAAMDYATNFIMNVVKPKTAAYLSDNSVLEQRATKMLRDALEAKGVKTVYWDANEVGTQDFKPFLGKILQQKPDLWAGFQSMPESIALNKQIVELGGWGNTQRLFLADSSAMPDVTALPAMEGSYVWGTWFPTLTAPGNKLFMDTVTAYNKATGKQFYPWLQPEIYWNVMLTTVKIIEAAGSTDRATVLKAGRSGKLQWESAMGTIKIDANGGNGLTGIISQDKGGVLTQVQ